MILQDSQYDIQEVYNLSSNTRERWLNGEGEYNEFMLWGRPREQCYKSRLIS